MRGGEAEYTDTHTQGARICTKMCWRLCVCVCARRVLRAMLLCHHFALSLSPLLPSSYSVFLSPPLELMTASLVRYLSPSSLLFLSPLSLSLSLFLPPEDPRSQSASGARWVSTRSCIDIYGSHSTLNTMC